MTMLRMCLALLLLAALPALAQGITERSASVNGVRINYKVAAIPEADRRLHAAAYASDDGMRAGFAATKLPMPFLVLAGEKASGTFLIEQTRLVATNVAGVVVKGSGHWLMEEAPGQVMPAIVEFLK